MPILSTLQGWKHGFNSPFKSEVYFVSTRALAGLKWGTPQPLMLRDADFGAIRLGAFGTYTLRCTDAKLLLKELVGTDGVYDTDEVGTVLRSLIQSSFADVLGKANVPALDLLSNYGALAERVRAAVLTQIDDEYGLDIPSLQIVNINLPEGVQKALDQRSSMGILGDMAKFQQYQMGNAMLAAAENKAGANPGLGMGMGVAMAGQMMSPHMNPGMYGGAPSGGPPPLPTAVAWHVALNGTNAGPFDAGTVQNLVAQGQVKPETLVWTNGMAAWTPAGQTPQLAALFASRGPPPLPT
jgi:membrane protease subunit (stomatin/prohibitin family)